MSAIWWMLIGGAAVFVAGVVYIFFALGGPGGFMK